MGVVLVVDGVVCGAVDETGIDGVVLAGTGVGATGVVDAFVCGAVDEVGTDGVVLAGTLVEAAGDEGVGPGVPPEQEAPAMRRIAKNPNTGTTMTCLDTRATPDPVFISLLSKHGRYRRFHLCPRSFLRSSPSAMPCPTI